MNIILKSATIIDSESSFHRQKVDIKIVDGVISELGADLKNPEGFQEIILNDLHVSRGWFDGSVCFGEPGYEDSETIANGLLTAAKSGFTSIALQPNANPITDNQSQLHFVQSKSVGFATKLYPIGALTKESAGKELAEMYDMKKAGAIAFGDYARSIKNANLLKIALQYTQDFGGIVIAYSEDTDLKGKGVVHEGATSTRLGLKGIPALAEELQLARNLNLLAYTGGRLHIPTISSAKSVELIREAKKKGLNVTCSVTVHHLILTDEVLECFDSRFKVDPPLRTEKDRQTLLEGVKDGTIDMITSDHHPIDIEHKKIEFDYARSGTIGLESAFGALMTVLPLELIIEKLTAGRQIFGITTHDLAVGKPADISLFNPNNQSVFTVNHIVSKSSNSAFLGRPIRGNVYGIFNQNKLVLQ